MGVLVLLLALLAGWGRAPEAAEVAHLFALYRAGELERLARELAEARRLRPDDVDLLFLAGLLALRRGEYGQARALLTQVMRAAPDYRDARLALARLHWWQGDPARARNLLRPMAAAAATDGELLELLVQLDLALGEVDGARKRLAQARAAGRIPPSQLQQLEARIAAWHPPQAPAQEAGASDRRGAAASGCCRLLVYGRHARWSDGRAPWAEGRIALSFRPDEATTLMLAGEVRRRFGRTDGLGELALTRRAGGGRWRLTLTLGPGARFSPRFAGELAGEVSLAKSGPAHALSPAGPPSLLLRLRLARYATGTALLTGIGLRFRPADRLALTLRLDGARDAGGRLDLGGSLRLDHRLGRTRLFGGLGLLLDDERGRTLEPSLFLGASWPLREGVRFFCDLDLVRRGAVRTGLGCGVSLALGRTG